MKRFLHHKLHEVQNSPRQHVQSGDFILCAKAMDDVLEGGPFLGGGDGRGGALGAGGEGAWFGVSREGGEEEGGGGGGRGVTYTPSRVDMAVWSQNWRSNGG